MGGEIIIIKLPIIIDKKYIKVISSKKYFYWTFEFSQTEDINYLPTNTAGKVNIEHSNTSYINNPYMYQPINTNFKWFIYLKHGHNEGIIFSYEYVNEKQDENENNNDSDKENDSDNENNSDKGNDSDNENNSEKDENYDSKEPEENSSNSVTIFWIFFVIIIVILILLVLYCLNKKRENSSKIEKLVSDVPNQQII